MQIGLLQFRPGLYPSLGTLLGLALFVGLGVWQLQRAELKKHWQAEFAMATLQAPVPLNEVMDTDRFRQVRVEGHYLPDRTLLLDNQISGGTAGVHVYTPFVPVDGGATLLVNRGWVAWPDRSTLPAVEVRADRRIVTGRLGQPANPGIRLGSSHTELRWPLLVTYIDYSELARVLDQPLRPVTVLLDEADADGFQRRWQPDFGGIGPERHRGYAVQWFGLALALIVIYLVTCSRWTANRGRPRGGPSA